MQLKPVKKYKKPVYAAAAAAVLTAAGMMTGCDVQTAGETPIVDTTEATTEVMLDGDVAVEESELTRTTTSECTSNTTATATELELDGDVVLETAEPELAGEVPMEGSQ